MADAWSDENGIPDEDASTGDLAGLFDFALDPSDRASDAWDAHLPSVQKAIADGYDLLAERPLGAGAFAEVWPAQEKRSQITVAIKAVRASDKLTPDACESVQVAEFELVRDHLHNLNVPRALHLGGLRDQTYVVFEWVEGRPLLEAAEAMESVADKLALAERVLETVAGIHGVGVVHADLKPEHFLVRHDGQVMCMDFGLAHRPVAPDLGLVKRQQFGGGTGPYMAPELQTLTPDRANGRTDVYALGKVLMQVLLPVSAWPKDLLDDPGSTQAGGMEASVANPLSDPSEAWPDSVGDKSQGGDSTHASQTPFANKNRLAGGPVSPKGKPEVLPPKWCQSLLATMVDPVPSRRPLDAKAALQAWQRRVRQAQARKQQARRMAWVVVLLAALVTASVLGFWAGRPAQWPVFQRFFAPDWQTSDAFKDVKLFTPVTWPKTNKLGDQADPVWRATGDPVWLMQGTRHEVQRRQLVAHDGMFRSWNKWMPSLVVLNRSNGLLPLVAWLDGGNNVLVADLATDERWLLDNLDNSKHVCGLAWFDPVLPHGENAARQLAWMTTDGRLFVYDLDGEVWLVDGATTPCQGANDVPYGLALFGSELALLGIENGFGNPKLWHARLGAVRDNEGRVALTGEVGRWQTDVAFSGESHVLLDAKQGLMIEVMRDPALEMTDHAPVTSKTVLSMPTKLWQVDPDVFKVVTNPARMVGRASPWLAVPTQLQLTPEASMHWNLVDFGTKSVAWIHEQAGPEGEGQFGCALAFETVAGTVGRCSVGEASGLHGNGMLLCESIQAFAKVAGDQLEWFGLYDGKPLTSWRLPVNLDAKAVEHLDWNPTDNTLTLVGKHGLWQWRLVPLSR